MEKIAKTLLCLSLILTMGCQQKKAALPNIVWIMLEDWGPQLSCYGEPGIETPHVDKLASEGIQYTHAFTTAPVCSPSRSAMMTGFHQNYINAHQHRTGEKFGIPKKKLPNGIKTLTTHLKEKNYFTVLHRSKKTDLNFTHNDDLFDGRDWKHRNQDQPFFAQITFEGTHRKWQRDVKNPIDTADVRVPPYYPQTGLVKRDWANGLEAMQIVDRQVGSILKRLDDENLTDNTLVFLIGDNGRCMPRGKQFLYDGGIHVPMIVRWPSQLEAGTLNTNLVSTIDITKTIMELIGATSSEPLHGRNLFDEHIKPRSYIYAAREKMDSTHDASRAIRSKKYKLIHNLMPERPYLQLNKYKERSYPTLAEMNVLFLQGKLNKEQEQFMASSKPIYELYDLQKDPHELNNLIDHDHYKEIKESLSIQLKAWREKINDQGVSASFRKGGWPSTFPTKTLEAWQEHLNGFKPWVFRKPSEKIKHPYSKW